MKWNEHEQRAKKANGNELVKASRSSVLQCTTMYCANYFEELVRRKKNYFKKEILSRVRRQNYFVLFREYKYIPKHLDLIYVGWQSE